MACVPIHPWSKLTARYCGSVSDFSRIAHLCPRIHLLRAQGPFSIYYWARHQPMRENVTYVTFSLIGWGLVQPWIESQDIHEPGRLCREPYQWFVYMTTQYPDSKVHGANVGPIWSRQDPGGPHVGPMNVAIWVCILYVWFAFIQSISWLPLSCVTAVFYDHMQCAAPLSGPVTRQVNRN